MFVNGQSSPCPANLLQYPSQERKWRGSSLRQLLSNEQTITDFLKALGLMFRRYRGGQCSKCLPTLFAQTTCCVCCRSYRQSCVSCRNAAKCSRSVTSDAHRPGFFAAKSALCHPSARFACMLRLILCTPFCFKERLSTPSRKPGSLSRGLPCSAIERPSFKVKKTSLFQNAKPQVSWRFFAHVRQPLHVNVNRPRSFSRDSHLISSVPTPEPTWHDMLLFTYLKCLYGGFRLPRKTGSLIQFQHKTIC